MKTILLMTLLLVGGCESCCRAESLSGPGAAGTMLNAYDLHRKRNARSLEDIQAEQARQAKAAHDYRLYVYSEHAWYVGPKRERVVAKFVSWKNELLTLARHNGDEIKLHRYQLSANDKRDLSEIVRAEAEYKREQALAKRKKQ